MRCIRIAALEDLNSFKKSFFEFAFLFFLAEPVTGPVTGEIDSLNAPSGSLPVDVLVLVRSLMEDKVDEDGSDRIERLNDRSE